MMEVTILEMLLANGVLGAVCAFFMWKDIRKDTKIVSTLDRVAIILDERLPRK